MEIMNVVSVPAIVAIVYGVINLIKHAIGESEKFKRLIPLLSAALGAILGIVLYYVMPRIVLAENVYEALIIGVESGLTATGTNQIFKQLNKSNDDKENNNEK